MRYETVIGLETHVQLATTSKAFCGDLNQFGEDPNRNISVISLGYPGTLPMLNERQVEFAVRLGLALGCKINLRSTFDRKNYFYADLPKGYQITQDENPICLGGALPIRLAPPKSKAPASATEKRSIQLHHIHMEEDAGKSIHAAGEAFSRVDLNRAGTPLLEIVTEPDLRSAEEVDAFMSGMRRLVRWLGVSDGNMQEGSLRCDVNVSVRPVGQEAFGTRCEIKNMNSMKFARQAVAYEVDRQIGILESGGAVQQQTRQFDPASGTTSALRDKEDAHDYRYFPDPDLPPVVLTPQYVDNIRRNLGTLPWEAFDLVIDKLGVTTEDAILICEDRENFMTFQRFAERHPQPAMLAKLWVNRIMPWANEQKGGISAFPLTPEQLVELHDLVEEGKIAAAAMSGKLLPALLDDPEAKPEALAEKLSLIQNSDGDFLAGLVDEVLTAYPDKVAVYKKGKKGLIGFFMGEVMKRSKGSAEPKETQALLRKKLDA
ncbi:Asp-tRNA(Asn)/Glu-tRNA(Gln) amidotransferase subunit GatB [Lewinella sp. W8]|uniref:Asp-tRNA(Asn)/Glu-tRNA(Gln) amidotransferase subunit GatB n=1 Tax=Lewinella sp. W8 TaxID=2528208 RepID=UPI00106830BD|nr:Asp-tRNA(Asn)/Glu-tRNA(Gln) amidotransferase subunit GatB [Lewinella sp. W8]MTB51561.1 Asp-tRNA(Asn)/Glu-tRNA(Gln) amidotransferase subunit GatB [Lewinella sp. W8]